MADEIARRRVVPGALVFLGVAVLATSAYANLGRITGSRDWVGFVPPFIAGYDASMLDHLGGEYLCIAEALAAGRGFADPFREPTGPTAWMPPVLPLLQAALIYALHDMSAVVDCVIFFQNLSLIVAGWVALLASRGPGGRPLVAASIFIALTWYHFQSCYQITHDCWLLLLGLSLLVAGASRIWGRAPSAKVAIGWGVAGGLAALAGPVLGLVWATTTAALALSARRFRPFLVSAAVAALMVSPWIARNYHVFGRFIPVKSNFAFEWYQSNRLEPDGVLRNETGATHPYRSAGEERTHYKELGEIAYLDEYRVKAAGALREDPTGYLWRIGNRLLAATVVYYPFHSDESGWGLWLSYALHPLPFYGLLFMLLGGGWRSDRLKVLAVIVYTTYLVPYVMVAYYERYALPLIGIQAMFCYWGWGAIAGSRTDPRVEEVAEMSGGGEASDARARIPWFHEIVEAIARPSAPEGITVVIPTLNDGVVIGLLVDAFFEILPRFADRHEVIVVVDGSDDGTALLLEQIGQRRPALKIIQHPTNLGYGAALVSGFRAAEHGLVYCTDGDAQYSPASLATLLDVADGADVVQGYRTVRMEGPGRRLASHVYNALLRLILRLPTRDTNCGSRLIRLDALRRMDLTSKGAFICAEIIARAVAAGMDVHEAGVVEYPRAYGQSRFIRLAPLLNLAGELANFLRQDRSRARPEPAKGR